MIETVTPTDSGPLYKETVLGRWPVEPWNTWSTLFFLFIAVYWFLRIKSDWRNQKLILTASIMIGIGFAGGFVYHSTRSHIFWLLLDWVPIVIISPIVATFYWHGVLENWGWAVFAALFPLIASIPCYTNDRFSSVIPMSLGYAAIAISVALPILLYARLQKWRDVKWLAWAAVCIIAALGLRTLDPYVDGVFPMGTHFLWHTLSAFTSHFLILYTYRVNR